MTNEQKDAANGAIGEREAFEAWGNETFNYGFQPETWDDGSGPVAREAQYTHEGTQMAWEGWQARAALTAEKVAGQEPVATLHDDGHYTWQGPKPDGFNYAGWRMEVYAAPQPAHPTQAEPVKDAAQEQSGEAIYQARMVGNTAWSDVTGDKLEACAANPNYEVRRVYAAPQLQPAQSAEQDEPCTNCGMSVDPKCACERGRKRAASTQSTATQPAQTEPKP